MLSFANRLPVLRRELVQQAASKRTYVVRCVYAGLLFLLFLSFAMDTLRLYRNTDVLEAIAAMGRGESLLTHVCMLQFLGTHLFLPAMMAGAIAHEKERHSFPLLLSTRLTQSEILLQKYVSRLIPMLTFLLLTLPVLGVAYLMGGLEASAVAWSACCASSLTRCIRPSRPATSASTSPPWESSASSYSTSISGTAPRCFSRSSTSSPTWLSSPSYVAAA